MTIRAITFDLDDTLWMVDPIIERAEQKMHQWLEEHCPGVVARYSTTQLRQLRMQVARERPDLVHDMGQVRIEALKIAVTGCGYPESMARSAFEVMWLARNEVTFFSDVLPVLEKLAQTFVLGAITNGNADIHRVGLGHLLDFSVSAREIGAPKPDARIFRAASEKAGVPPAQILHVGDDPVLDVAGASSAGMRAVLLNRPELGKGNGPGDYPELLGLDELEPLLRDWQIL